MNSKYSAYRKGLLTYIYEVDFNMAPDGVGIAFMEIYPNIDICPDILYVGKTVMVYDEQLGFDDYIMEAEITEVEGNFAYADVNWSTRRTLESLEHDSFFFVSNGFFRVGEL